MEIFKHPDWSRWRKFPDPRNAEYITAPFGRGVYQLRLGKEFILFGSSNHCASRITSLLSKPYGQGTRNNEAKKLCVFENLGKIEYRTLAFLDQVEMKKFESTIKSFKIHRFNS